MILGNELVNAPEVLAPYIKDTKLTSQDKYVFTTEVPMYGRVIFCPSENNIRMIQLSDIHDKYINKVFYVDAIMDKDAGVESPYGIIESINNITIIRANEAYNNAINVLMNLIVNDLKQSTKHYCMGLHEQEDFVNNVLNLRASDGMGKYIRQDLNEPYVLMLSPQMLPGTKKNGLDLIIHSNPNNRVYYVSEFITHKKFDVITFIKFLYV